MNRNSKDEVLVSLSTSTMRQETKGDIGVKFSTEITDRYLAHGTKSPRGRRAEGLKDLDSACPSLSTFFPNLFLLYDT